LPREAGATSGFTICDLAVRTPGVSKHPTLYFLEYCGKIQMLPPIEFFMGMLGGGILGYLVAILVNDRNEAGHR
jgi:hypothetical protein